MERRAAQQRAAAEPLAFARVSQQSVVTLGGRLICSGDLTARGADAAGLGYKFILHFIELPSEEYAIERVARRVAAGGHHIPEADVRRRFQRGLQLFATVYRLQADEWYHWFSDEKGLRLVERRKQR